jgi:hypothetical protein
MKYIKIRDFIKTLCGFALVLLMAGCANVLNAPAAPEAKTGKATFFVNSGPARTVVPSLSQFASIVLSFEARNGAPEVADLDATSGQATVQLPPGAWDVTAKAFLEGAAEPAAVSEAHAFSYDGETVSGNPRFILVPAGTGPGTLKYTITVPDGVTLDTGSRMLIELPQGIEIEDAAFTNGEHAITETETDAPVALPAGSYAVDILLKNSGGDTAVFRESVVILSGLVTELSYAPAAGAFLAPEVRAAMTDVTVLEFQETIANISDVSVEALAATSDPFVYTLAINALAETNPVYFALAKTAGHSVAVGGDNAPARVFDTGEEAEGSEAGDPLAVFAVDTASVLEEGGDLHFTLNVEEEGKAAIAIALTLTVEAPPIRWLWIDTAGDGQQESLTAVPNQAAITDLQAALDWLTANAEDDTKYVVKVSDNGQLTDSFSSKSGNQNVRITLRGIGKERVILTNAQISLAGLFTVNAGTTLVLDENITVDGQNKNLFPDPNVGGVGQHLFHVKGGTLEMKAGSKITRSLTWYQSPSSVLIESGAFKMYGGTIDQSTGIYYVIGITGGSFEMWDGAITQNKQFAGYDNMNDVAQQIYGGFGVLSIEGTATFTMYGGEISNNDYRGVSLGGTATFVMKGGRIINNGKSPYPWNSQNVYPQGGGVYSLAGSNFYMEGGEISDNGDFGTPGSGIYKRSSSDTVNFILNGPVTIKNNTIMFSHTSMDIAWFGSKFFTNDPIYIDLVCLGMRQLFTTFEDVWDSNKLLFYALDEDNDTITIDSSLINKFSVAKCFFANPSSRDFTEFPELSATINADSSVTIVDTANQ